MTDHPLGWHFSTGTLGYGDGRKIEAGITHTVDVKPVLCKSGLHDSVRIIDALDYAPAHVLTRTRLGGTVVVGYDKRCGTERTYLAVIDAEPILHEFACRCAERVLERVGEPDPCSVKAIAAKRAWIRGEITDKQLDAARTVARATKWATERDAVWIAASGAAWDAARAAARATASFAASDSAWDAARNAEREWQNDELTRMAFEAMEEAGYVEGGAS